MRPAAEVRCRALSERSRSSLERGSYRTARPLDERGRPRQAESKCLPTRESAGANPLEVVEAVRESELPVAGGAGAGDGDARLRLGCASQQPVLGEREAVSRRQRIRVAVVCERLQRHGLTVREYTAAR